MSKRDLFEELKQGLLEARDHDRGKLTLRTHKIDKFHIEITAQEIRAIREQFDMSRAVFAAYLHISPRTLEKWEQGLSKPNDQAIALLKLTEKYPDTLHRLLAI
jgi:putative transcriptional regulator